MLQREERGKYKNNLNNYKKQKPSSNSNKKNWSFSKKMMVIYAFILCMLGFVFVFYISQSLTINQLNLKVNNLENDLDELKDENDKLNLKIAKNVSLSRIENIARNELNMKEPDQTEIVEINSGNNKNDFNNIKENDKYKNDKYTDSFFFAKIFEDIWNKINVVKAESVD
ncbi:MAG: cell division protein FtsL [Bacillota bacterium]